MAALPLQNLLSQNTTFDRVFRKREMRLGDGFSSRAMDGLNAKEWKGNIEYVNITLADFNTIMTFLDGIGGWGTFDYTPAGSAVSCKFSVDNGGIKTTQSGGSIYTVSFSCRQEWDL